MSASKTLWLGFMASLAALAMTSAPAAAQQITGVPGSPSATTTIDGKQLPPPPGKFGGVIKESAKDSKSFWPPRVVPPKGAPNVLLIMTDDQGYGVSGTFGGVIPTPALDRIAKAGIRYTNFHSTSLCSPPENREEAVSKLFESVGGKLIGWYLTFGHHDWLVIGEFPDDKACASAVLAAAAGGSLSDIETTLAMTAKDAHATFVSAGKAAKAFRSAGRA